MLRQNPGRDAASHIVTVTVHTASMMSYTEAVTARTEAATDHIVAMAEHIEAITDYTHSFEPEMTAPEKCESFLLRRWLFVPINNRHISNINVRFRTE